MAHLSLRAESVTAGYAADHVLDSIDLTVVGGRRLAVLGANGSGKTTLLRCLSGAMRPSRGRIWLGDQPLDYSRKGLRQHREQVQLVLQNPDDQLFSADVARDVSFGPLNLGLPSEQVRGRVAEALELLGVTELADRSVHRLSFGQRKRVAIAGAIAMRPCLLLLDEPTAGLDAAGTTDMLAALGRLEREQTTVVLATHDVDLALAWADRVAVVVDRGVVDGEPVELLGDLDLLRRSRLRRPWVLEVATRLGLGQDPDAAPLRDLDGLVDRILGGSTRVHYPT